VARRQVVADLAAVPSNAGRGMNQAAGRGADGRFGSHPEDPGDVGRSFRRTSPQRSNASIAVLAANLTIFIATAVIETGMTFDASGEPEGALRTVSR
jgi:hypothetical protein